MAFLLLSLVLLALLSFLLGLLVFTAFVQLVIAILTVVAIQCSLAIDRLFWFLLGLVNILPGLLTPDFDGLSSSTNQQS